MARLSSGDNKSRAHSSHKLAAVVSPIGQLANVNQLDAVITRELTYEAGRGSKKKTILNRINLTVPEGSIYGLLGPSGCGKTTMLKCIVGRIKPRAGSVLVFGLQPGDGLSGVPGRDVGYMPQEISIYEDFTIEETLHYFGKINRMRASDIKSRVEFLLQFLDLPSRKRTVVNLSGGQKRRVSLAAALVHSPPLLILDEPTVGVDPLLRQSIWQHLVAMTRSERISVIITTHYIEEARLANVVGLMRNGRILAENSPDELMHLNQLTNLEDVFLKLCMSDSSRRAAQLASGGQTQRAHSTRRGGETTANRRQRSHRQQGASGLNAARLKSPIEATNLTDDQHKLALRLVPTNNSHKATVRIHTGTNEIELLHGGHVNEAVEVFSSESDIDGSNNNDDDDDDDDDNHHLDIALSRSTPLPTLTPPATHSTSTTLSTSEPQANDEDTESYLELQQLQWTTRRANVAEMWRIHGRRLERGPYLGLDGRKPHYRHSSAGSAHWPIGRQEYERSYGFVQWWKTLMAVTWKNYVRLRRNPPVLVFQFILPAIQVILFCLCIGGEPFDVPVAIVNDELVPKSSVQFLNGLNRKIIRQIKYDNLTSAIEAVRRGKVWGAIHIPNKYSENLQSRLIMGEEVTNETISNGTIRVYPDLTNLHLAMTLERTFREAFINFAHNSLEELGYDRSLADLPIQIAEPVYGTMRKDGYLEFMAPGVVISISYVMATGLTALAFILERRDGLLERSLVSGVQTSQILLAHAINQVFVMIIQIFLVLGCTFFIFEIPSRGPFFWVVLLILLQGCTGMGFGLLVSAICAEENTAVMMVVGTFYTNLILAGIIWPIEAMPHWLRPVSYAQPQTLPTDTLRHILSRGWSIFEPAVMLGFAITIGWLVVFLIAAGLIFKYSR